MPIADVADAVVVGLALLSAFFAALGIVIRQRATRHVPADAGVGAGVTAAAAREPLWWAGTVAAIVGYGFQALALSRGSLLLVQPLLVSALLFALPMSARFAGHAVTRADWVWAMLLTAGLTVFVLVGQPREGFYRPPVPAWSVVSAVFVPLVVGCVVVAVRATGPRRALPLGVAVAVLLGAIAVLIKVCTHRYAEGGPAMMFTAPAPYLLVALAAAATVLQQAAFHAGELTLSVPAMLVGEPVVAVLMGIIVFGEHLAVSGPAVILLVVAVAAMVVSTVALGRDSGAQDDDLGDLGDLDDPGGRGEPLDDDAAGVHNPARSSGTSTA